MLACLTAFSSVEVAEIAHNIKLLGNAYSFDDRILMFWLEIHF